MPENGMATVRKTSGAANVTFGLSGIALNGAIVQGYGKDTSSDKAEAMYNAGETAAVSFYNTKSKVTVDGLVNTAGAFPNVGDAITINSDSGFVDTVSLSGDMNGFRKVRLEATIYATSLS